MRSALRRLGLVLSLGIGCGLALAPTPAAGQGTAGTRAGGDSVGRPSSRGRPPPRPASTRPTPTRQATPRATSRPPASTGEARSLPGVEVATSATADTVAIGDPFDSLIRIRVPAGARVEVTATPSDTAAVQVARPPRVVRTDSASAEPTYVAIVSLRPWATGRLPRVTARVRVTPAGGTARTMAVELRLPHVRSVLPADSTKWRPKGAKDVLGPSWNWRPLALAAVAALILLWALFAVARGLVRRLRRPQPRDSRREALAALDAARAAGLAERGETVELYARVAAALRGFAAGLSPRWSADLTTAELRERMAADGVGADDVAPLAEVLAAADLAKFAGRMGSPDEALRHLAEARAWVQRFEPGEAVAGGEPDDGNAADGAPERATAEVGS